MNAGDFLRYALDQGRLAVLGTLAARACTLAELAEFTSQRERDVLRSLAPLVQAELVTRDGERYRLRGERLRELAKDLPQAEPAAPEVMFGMTTDEQAVLRRFFRGDQLIEIPATRSKRLIVLERITCEFEPGVRYLEAEVSNRLSAYHDDYAALRRYLIDEGFLDRDQGLYWRSGGRVE